MAKKLLSTILNGEVDHTVVVNAIQSAKIIQVNDATVQLSDFISHFLSYLREQLTPIHEARSVYYSPRQIEEKNKKVRQDSKKYKDLTTKKSARISLQYSSSSPNKVFDDLSKDTNGISGISPIRTGYNVTPQNKSNNKSTLFSSPTNLNSTTKNRFEINSLDDFPSISLSTKSSKKMKVKSARRITATPVRTNNESFTSTKTELSNPVFLEDSSFESQHTDSSFNGLFVDDKRFTNDNKSQHLMTSNSSFESVFEQSKYGFDNGFDSINDKFDALDIPRHFTPTKISSNFKDLAVRNIGVLHALVDIYVSICIQHYAPNLTLELYFLFLIMTQPLQKLEETSCPVLFPFENMKCSVYFAVKCLEKLTPFVVLLDFKTIQLLAENPCFQELAHVNSIDVIQDAMTKEVNKKFQNSFTVKSPMTGIPFQVESDNRKSFSSDKHFYSFSKKRDAFYALVREWQENYLDPDWNMKSFMMKKVPEIMYSNDGTSTHYQFAKLFVAQLLEMCRDNLGSKTDEANTSDSLLLELKKLNPNKFRNLQDRLTRPSVTHDLCPTPSFSQVEGMFKEFIQVADSYCFSRFLVHVLLSNILDLNGASFGLEGQVNNQLNKSDVAASIWQNIKTAITELRLLAKFLGFVVFLPYQCKSQMNGVLAYNREQISENFDFYSVLKSSYEKQKLLITVPWIVDFFSMADREAAKLEHFYKALKYLTSLLTSSYMKTMRTSNPICSLALVLHIAWLFEQPALQNLRIYEDHTTTYDFQLDDVKKEIGIDDVVIVDKPFLYHLCPYLIDMKKPLLDFMKGSNRQTTTRSFRKITPVRTSDVFSIDMKENLKIQLMDSFMKYLPVHTQDIIKFVTERHFMNIKHHIWTTIMNSCCEYVINEIKESFTYEIDEEPTLERLTIANRELFTKNLEIGRRKVEVESRAFMIQYLQERISVSVENLLPSTTHSKIVEVAGKVIKHNVCLKIQEWIVPNRELFTNNVDASYTRYIKGIIKTKQKEMSFEIL